MDMIHPKRFRLTLSNLSKDRDHLDEETREMAVEASEVIAGPDSLFDSLAFLMEFLV